MNRIARIDASTNIVANIELWDQAPEDTSEHIFRGAGGDAGIGWSWDGSCLIAPPPAPPVAPDQVAMHRAKKALVIQGWMPAVEAAIDAIDNEISRRCARIEFDTAPNLQREGATTLAIMAAVGMTPAQRDEMLLLAQTLP